MESMGYIFGILGFIFALGAMQRVNRLEKLLREKGLLDEAP